jgi:mRNA-degrading endonuclease RelE of RelBE toxin-antitoxin system
MSYRILVEPAAAQRLRTFSSYIVQRLGRLLAELADLASIAPPAGLTLARNADAELARVELEGATVWYRVDRREETLTLVDIAAGAGDQPGAQAG